MEHIDVIAKAAFSFLFSSNKETSLVFNDINLSAHLSETSKQFALDSGLLSKRKGKKCTDQTLSFVHKTIQEFLTAFHIYRNGDVIGEVISGYLKRHDNSYRDISQMFIFLCGFNISAANKLSALMNDLDINSDYHRDFQKCILSGYKEAVANKNTPIVLHLSHFKFSRDNAGDLIKIWALNTSRARSLYVDKNVVHVIIRTEDASSSLCKAPGPDSLFSRDCAGPSTRADQEEVKSSASCMEFDLSSYHNLQRLVLNSWFGRRDYITVLPNALLGLNNLKYLEILGGCRCEALDLTYSEHIESIKLDQGVTLLPLSLNNYKTLNCIELDTTYDGLDLSLFENLKWITISSKVKVLPKPLPMHNKLTYIGVRGVDFNSFDNGAIHTWCLLNGADPLQSEGYTPVRSSVEHIALFHVTCPGLWETLLDQNINHLSYRKITSWNNVEYLKVDNVSSMTRSLAFLSQLETLTMHLHEYIDLQLPPSLKHLTVYYATLSPAELRYLVNKLSLRTQSGECRLGFCCGNKMETCGIKNKINCIPSEDYIPIKQEFEAREHVEVKLRIYDRTPNTDAWPHDAWSVRDSFGDDDYGDEIADNEFYNIITRHYDNVLSRISMRLNINCFKIQP
ncbi:hypothetical protein DPMN_096423 [Dreissena polymorpha]|uniref:Uncharacterized protein n=1 Tax=Dreissena polymorpha TaxID=45954 RepID=A0A9D4R4G4_DREPO|nr:hypothetical protein DPMN_096423 [Dreissena polymorpha]